MHETVDGFQELHDPQHAAMKSPRIREEGYGVMQELIHQEYFESCANSGPVFDTLDVSGHGFQGCKQGPEI